MDSEGVRITYLHQYFNTTAMSGGTRSYEMARRMVDAGHEVHMITSIRDESFTHGSWFETQEAGIHVHWYPVLYSNHMGFYDRIKAFIRFALAARNRALQLDADIVFATSTPLTIAIPAVPAARKKKVPLVFEVRDLWPEMPIAVGALRNPVLKFFARRLEHWAYHNSDAVVALSPGMKEGVVRTGYPAQQVAVIPNSSDNSEFRHDEAAAASFRSVRPWLGDKPLLVYTGTFGPTNGVGYLVDVAKELLAINSDIRVLLVGDGAQKKLIFEKARNDGVLGENLFIEDPLPKRDIPALLSAATMASALFIDLPEMRPNSANKFFDALASGTPLLINYGGWMHDLMIRHGFGLAMWQRTPEAVAAELERFMHDQQWLSEAGAKARKLAEEYFSRDLLAAQLIEVLETVAKGGSKRPSEIAPGVYP